MDESKILSSVNSLPGMKNFTLSQTTSFRLPNWKNLQTTISNLMKMTESSPFPTVLSKDLYCRHKKPGLVCERVIYSIYRNIDFKEAQNDAIFLWYGRKQCREWRKFIPTLFSKGFFPRGINIKSQHCVVKV